MSIVDSMKKSAADQDDGLVERGVGLDFATEVLSRAGLDEADARVVAASLIFAELRGVKTHGLLRLGIYVERILAGGINGKAKADIVADLGALVIIDADAAAGAVSGTYACDIAVERAREHGVGCVIIRNGNHFGASAFFTNRIADAGLLGLAACNTESVMSAPGGGRPVLGTNPLAVAVPLPYASRPQLDMATTTVSQGALLVAKANNESIPLGWAVDVNGQPTTSPFEGLAGALTPAGGPKGFGLAFVVDTLVALAGANVSPSVTALDADPKIQQQLGQFFMAIRADAADSLDGYQERIGALVDAIHNSGIDGSQPMAPGEPETKREHQSNGKFALSPSTIEALSTIAAKVGAPPLAFIPASV
jgi:LDH2 family malate/lactate/ureidoglycolate dehydrogenase